MVKYMVKYYSLDSFLPVFVRHRIARKNFTFWRKSDSDDPCEGKCEECEELTTNPNPNASLRLRLMKGGLGPGEISASVSGSYYLVCRRA